MQKLFRSPIVWILVPLGAIIVLLYCLGFRITYAPTLENSWDAISACAGWFGAIMSAIAIFVAIRIPKKIAEQQNNISLFEKRYSAFDAFAFLISVIKQVVDGNIKDKNYRFYLDNMIDTYNSISITKEFTSDCKEQSDVYIRLLFEAGKIKYLFELEQIETVIDFLFVVDQYVADVYLDRSCDVTALCEAYIKLDWEGTSDKLESQLKI